MQNIENLQSLTEEYEIPKQGEIFHQTKDWEILENRHEFLYQTTNSKEHLNEQLNILEEMEYDKNLDKENDIFYDARSLNLDEQENEFNANNVELESDWVNDLVQELEKDELKDIFSDKYPHNLIDFIESKSFSETTTTSVDLTRGEIFLMILKFCLSNCLSVTAMTNLFKLVNTIFRTDILPATRYVTDRLLNVTKGVEFHAVCHNCSAYLGKFGDISPTNTCNVCNIEIDLSNPSNSSFFVLIDPSTQISDLLKANGNYYEYVTKYRVHEQGYIQDVYDGKMYRQFVNSLSEHDKLHYVTASFNTDGAPKFKCSQYSIWPLYLSINELPPQTRMDKIITCGLYFHKKKPEMQVLLSKFVDLINNITEKGIDCKISGQQRKLKLHVLTCCVDAVARAAVQGIHQFNGEYGCNWCIHPGVYSEGSMRYPVMDKIPEPRTHVETVQLMLESNPDNTNYGVKYPSPLINFTFFNIILGFIVDYMHCCLEGVAKQFTNYYLFSLSDAQITNFDEKMKKITVPQQVSRLTRSLSCRNDWKAREWECFVLYYSIPILSLFLPKSKLDHWILFVESLYILLKDKIHVSDLNIANAKLYKFVSMVEELYGIKAMTYNVHLLLHISESVLNWGPLWANSTFSFEAANRYSLQAIKCARGVPQQIARYVNLSHSVLVIEEHLKNKINYAVEHYCNDILSARVKNTNRTSNSEVIYFGKGDYVEDDVLNYLNLTKNSMTFRKMVKDTCLYESYTVTKTRSNNSFAQLKNGTFIRIIKFILDEDDKKELTMCNIVNTRNYSSTCYKMLKILDNIEIDCCFISTSNIDRICIYMDVSGNTYLCPLPNLYHY